MFFILICSCSLPVYRKSVPICVLVLFLATLLSSLISSRSVLFCFVFGRFFGIFCIDNHVMCKKRQCYFFLSICTCFMSFFGMILKRSCEGGILALFPILRGKHLVSPLSMKLAIGFYVIFNFFFFTTVLSQVEEFLFTHLKICLQQPNQADLSLDIDFATF